MTRSVMPRLTGTLCLIAAMGLAACNKPGSVTGGKVIDQRKSAIKMFEKGMRTLGVQTMVESYDQNYLPEVYQALAGYPNREQARYELANIYVDPKPGAKLEIPHLLVIIGALHREGYDGLPTELFGGIVQHRLFGLEARLFPDPTSIPPLGFNVDPYLASAYEALGPDTTKVLTQRLQAMFGKNPASFSPRDLDWARRLLAGEQMDLKAKPEDLYHQAVMAAVALDYSNITPALRKIANDKKALYDYRFTSAAGILLLDDSPEAIESFKKTVFTDRFITLHFTWPAYRVLAYKKDPALYDIIKLAMEQMPAQATDYGEFLAAYGKPEDKAKIIELIESPITPSDYQLSMVRSPNLLNPVTKDYTLARQPEKVLKVRDATDLAALVAEGEKVPKPKAPPNPRTLQTEEEPAKSVAWSELGDLMKIPEKYRWPVKGGRDGVRARRLWWLRNYPTDLVAEFLAEKIATGGPNEQIVAIRLLGQSGNPNYLGAIGHALGSKHTDRVRAEAAAWYLHLWQKKEAAESGATAEAASGDVKAPVESPETPSAEDTPGEEVPA